MKLPQILAFPILCCVSLIVLSDCASAPRYYTGGGSTPMETSAKTSRKEAPLLLKGSNHTAVFTASYYGPKFHGKLASNGQVFDMYKNTAAHKSLPFGTVLKITYPVTGKSVDVTIIDRGPFIEGRDIDLSFAAAQDIGLVKNGVGKVNVTVVKWGDGTTYHKKGNQ